MCLGLAVPPDSGVKGMPGNVPRLLLATVSVSPLYYIRPELLTKPLLVMVPILPVKTVVFLLIKTLRPSPRTIRQVILIGRTQFPNVLIVFASKSLLLTIEVLNLTLLSIPG